MENVPETGLAARLGTMRNFYLARAATLATYNEPTCALAVSGAKQCHV